MLAKRENAPQCHRRKDVDREEPRREKKGRSQSICCCHGNQARVETEEETEEKKGGKREKEERMKSDGERVSLNPEPPSPPELSVGTFPLLMSPVRATHDGAPR